jgi:hypothetical protein
MNNTTYLLNTNDDIYLYTDLNSVVIKLLKIIKKSFVENLNIKCYVNNSKIIYKQYYFNFDKYYVQDNFNNTVKLSGEYKYIQNVLINDIKNMYKNSSKNKEKMEKLLEKKREQEEIIKQMKENIKNEQKELDSNKKKKEKEEIKRKEFDASLKAFFLIKEDISNNVLKEDDINTDFKIPYKIFKELNIDIHNFDIDDLIKKYSERFKYYNNIEKIKNYMEDKKMYLSIKEDVDKNKIYVSDISSKFSLKYRIFDKLSKNKLLNDVYEYDETSNMTKEYNMFIEINNSINKYEPHNKNYIDTKKINYDENIQKIINKLVA